MPVRDRRYRGYDGPRTPRGARFLVVPRYALREVFASRLLTAFFGSCFFLPILGALLIYVKHNVSLLTALQVPVHDLLRIDEEAFLGFLAAQGLGFGFLLTVVVAPGLMSADLRNNALPLYLARPFSRLEYVLGKLSVLALLLSAVTWIPGLLLFALQASLDTSGWGREHFRIAPAIFIGSWVWIVVLSLVALALSALVRIRPLASGLLIGVVLIGHAFAGIMWGLLETRIGYLFDLHVLILTVWGSLAGKPLADSVPAGAAWLALGAFLAGSSWILSRKVRAYEVVR